MSAGWGHQPSSCPTCTDRAEMDALRIENADLRAALVAVCSARVGLSPADAETFRDAMRPHRAIIDACRPPAASGRDTST